MKDRSAAIRWWLKAGQGIKQPLIAQDVATQLLTLSLSPTLLSIWHYHGNKSVEKIIWQACLIFMLCAAWHWEKIDSGGEKRNSSMALTMIWCPEDVEKRGKNQTTEALKGSFGRRWMSPWWLGAGSLLWCPLRSSCSEPKWAPVSWSEDSHSRAKYYYW